jgi:hypothetical protein
MNRLGILLTAMILASCSGIYGGPRTVEIAAAPTAKIQCLRYKDEKGNYSAKKEEWKTLTPRARDKLINWLNAKHDWRGSFVTYAPDLVFKGADFNLNCGSGYQKIAVMNYRRYKDVWEQVYTTCNPDDWKLLNSLTTTK